MPGWQDAQAATSDDYIAHARELVATWAHECDVSSKLSPAIFEDLTQRLAKALLDVGERGGGLMRPSTAPVVLSRQHGPVIPDKDH